MSLAAGLPLTLGLSLLFVEFAFKMETIYGAGERPQILSSHN